MSVINILDLKIFILKNSIEIVCFYLLILIWQLRDACSLLQIDVSEEGEGNMYKKKNSGKLETRKAGICLVSDYIYGSFSDLF